MHLAEKIIILSSEFLLDSFAAMNACDVERLTVMISIFTIAVENNLKQTGSQANVVINKTNPLNDFFFRMVNTFFI